MHSRNSTPLGQRYLTQTPTCQLLLKPSSTRLFPCSSDTAPSSPCVISALRLGSTRSLRPCSRRMKSVLPSLNMRSLLSLAGCRTPIPSRRCSRSWKTREGKIWCAMRRRRLLVESPRTRSCPCCEGGPLKRTRPGWSGKAVSSRLTCGRYVILLTSTCADPHEFTSMRIRISSSTPMASIGPARYKPQHSSLGIVITSTSQTLTLYLVISPSLSNRAIRVACYYSAKLTAKYRALSTERRSRKAWAPIVP
jgi:hypothetical protein